MTKPIVPNLKEEINQPATILVVEDVDQVRELLRVTLERFYTIIEAASGEQALKMMHTGQKPDLVILDYVLSSDSSKLTGMELCLVMKQDPALADIPILVLSGRVTIDDVADFLAHCASTFIAKPFRPRMLLDQIAKLLGR